MKNPTEKGLFRKYQVIKISNPGKVIDGIVLEFDDPIAHEAIWTWANNMRDAGYSDVFNDVMDKLNSQGFKTAKRVV